MKLARQIASPPLRPLVAGFGQRRADLRAGRQVAVPPARPIQMIEIYLAERFGVGRADEPVRASPEVAVVGPQSRPGLTIHMSGQIDVFTIYFQPTGLHRLFDLPMPALVDQGVELASLIGARARSLHEAVLRESHFAARIMPAEEWLLARLESARAETAIDLAARLLLRSAGTVRVSDLRVRSGLSSRQFERRFVQSVGLPPKLYGRTARLARALKEKALRPELGWSAVAALTGYADQAHLVRECSALAGAPPARFVALGGG